MIKKNIMLIFLCFSVLFFIFEQYLFSFLILPFLLIGSRIEDIDSLTVSVNEVIAKFDNHKYKKKIEKVVRSEKNIKQKVKKSQELVDQVFFAGYQAAGGRLKENINNIKIYENNDGEFVIRHDSTNSEN